MGVLYEHWRTDLNECFYVGISWYAEDARPYNMRDRNPNHISVQKELELKGLEPEVRLIECAHLTDVELGQLEYFQISYWKDLIGDRLTNILPGGISIWNNMSDDGRTNMGRLMSEGRKKAKSLRNFEEAEKAHKTRVESARKIWLIPEEAARITAAQNSPEAKAKKSFSLKTTLALPEVFEKRSNSQKLTWENPVIRHRRLTSLKEAHGRPESKAKKSSSAKEAHARMTSEEKADFGRKISEGRKRAKEAREAAKLKDR